MKNVFKIIGDFKKKMGKWLWVAVAILALGVVGFLLLRGKQKEGNLTAIVKKGTVKEELVLSGQVEAEKHAILYFPTSGKISWVGVKEGDQVKKGQVLTSLDKTTLNAIYQQALNNYRNYQASAENVLDTVKNHSSDESYSQKAERTAAEVARDNSYDALKAAEYNLNNATITAPFDGVIASLPFQNSGVNVMVTDAQVEIIDPKSIYFAVDADQTEVTGLKLGQKVIVTLDSISQEISGNISFIGFTPKTGESNIVYEVKVRFDNIQNLASSLKVGMTGDAKFVISQKDDALYVPSRFISSDQNGKYVLLGSKKNKVYVKIGIEGEENVEILEGVKEGDVLYD